MCGDYAGSSFEVAPEPFLRPHPMGDLAQQVHRFTSNAIVARTQRQQRQRLDRFDVYGVGGASDGAGCATSRTCDMTTFVWFMPALVMLAIASMVCVGS